MAIVLAPPTNVTKTGYERLVGPLRQILSVEEQAALFGELETPEIPGPVEGLNSDQLRALADWQVEEEVNQRVAELGRRANAGTLTPFEREEVEGYLRADDFIANLKLDAMRQLRRMDAP